MSAAAPLHVGPLRLWTPVVLAPMAGVTDVPFRRLCRIMGESGLPDHLRPAGIPSWAAESGEGATASSPKPRPSPTLCVTRSDHESRDLRIQR